MRFEKTTKYFAEKCAINEKKHSKESVVFLPYWIVCPTKKHHILVLNEKSNCYDHELVVCGQKTEIDIEAMFENGIYAKKKIESLCLKKD